MSLLYFNNNLQPKYFHTFRKDCPPQLQDSNSKMEIPRKCALFHRVIRLNYVMLLGKDTVSLELRVQLVM